MRTRIVLAVGLAFGLCWFLSDVLQAQANELVFPGVENWDASIGSINLTRTVHSLAFDHQYLYLGEGFGTGDRHIRRWDGSQWKTIDKTDGQVLALLVDRNGNLYAGGYFTRTDTCNLCKRIARWDGFSWSALGNGITGEVLSLAKDSQGNLYAGGDFGVKRWNGTTWEDENITDTVYDLALAPNGALFAAGRGSYVDEDSGDLIEFPSLKVKNSGSWQDVGQAFTHSGPNTIFSLALYPPNIFTPTVGGDFGAPTFYLASWVGNEWQSFGTPDGPVLALAEDTCGGLYVGGMFRRIDNSSKPFLAYFDSQRWHSLGYSFTTNSEKVEVLRFRHGYLAVGGVFTQTFGSQKHRNIALWTGRDCAQITSSGTYTFYNWREPVTIQISNPGNLAEIRVQRFNKSHPEIDRGRTPNLDNGVYWQIEGTTTDGQPIRDLAYTLTLPSVGFIPDEKDKICHYLGNSNWDCAASGFDAAKKTITRSGLTSFSDFTVGNDVGPTSVSIKSIRAESRETSFSIVLLSIILAAISIVYYHRVKASRET
ncbi:MAG: hypothetical protein RML93_12795 [Anaerolineales bacterium]|nr:hypothetical protein [Anaerolineales bacterium]MDW8448153.1 hypothetical protein [Anaerolineales bacterium]